MKVFRINTSSQKYTIQPANIIHHPCVICANMSFRIDDILKETTKQRHDNIRADESSQMHGEFKHYTQDTVNKPLSILEYTLSNKNLYNQQQQQCFNNKFNVHYDTVSSSFGDSYLLKAGTGALYGRDQIWPPYLPYSMMFSCEHLHNRRKGGQVRFTASQTEELEKQFSSHKYLSPEDRKQLANLLRLSDRQVKTWFQNRRAKWRRNNHPGCNNRDTNTLQRNMDEFSGKNSYQT